MIRLEKSSLKVGNVVPTYLDGKFEGFATLIEQSGPPISYMDSSEGPVYIKVKWLIEWTSADKLSLTKEHLWNQRFLQGKRTYRSYTYKVADDWDTYAARYSGGREKGRERMNDKFLDDSNLLF